MIGNTCKIKGCKNILKKTDGCICQMHKSRFYRHGNYDISPKWTMLKKGQPCLTPLGYLRIFINGKRVLQHRYIMEQYLGRKLTKKERVHHINKIKTDNRIENLELFANQSKHIRKNHNKKPLIDWTKYNIPKHNIKDNCLVIDCNLKAKTRSLCKKHYLSYWRNYLKLQKLNHA